MSELNQEIDKFLPEHLQSLDLYQKIKEITNYLEQNCYTPHILQAKNVFRSNAPGFNIRNWVETIDQSPLIRDLIVGLELNIQPFDNPVNTETARSNLGHVLPRIFRLKGTFKGLRFLMDFLGIHDEITYFEGWRVKEAMTSSDPDDVAYYNAFQTAYAAWPADDLDCRVFFVLSQTGQNSILANGGSLLIELQNLFREFMWSCALFQLLLTNRWSESWCKKESKKQR